MVLIHSPVGKDDYVHALPACPIYTHDELGQGFLKGCILVMKYGDHRTLEAFLIKGTYLQKIYSGEDRIVDL